MKRVLVAAYGGAHVAIAIPVREALIRAGFEPVMLGLTTAVDVLRRNGIPCRRVLDYVDLHSPGVARWGGYLSEFHHREGIGISRDESMAYLGAGMAELVEEVGESQAVELHRQLGLNALLPKALLQRILEQEAIDGVITTDSPRAERAALNAAQALGIPSVCVVSNFPHIGMEYLRRPDNGAVMCVLNERIRSQLIEAGRAPGSVVVTGNPAFDALASPDNPRRRRTLRAQAGLADCDWTVLWAEQPEPADPDLPRRMRQHLMGLCRTHGWRLMVRLHPSSQAAGGDVLPAGALESPRTESTRDALLKSDAVVTFTSTIGFEALVLDKPVVVVAVSQYSGFVDYSERDGVHVAGTIDQVEAALLSFHRDDAQARKLAGLRRAMPSEGGAAAAVVASLSNQRACTSANA